jgi:hypothetical protein
MKKTLTLLSLTATLLISCDSDTRVTQEVINTKNPRDANLVCDGKPCIGTFILYQNNVIYAKFDDAETVTDSVLIERRKEAQRILDAINKMQ